MTNADKFKFIFGIYATELWAKSEEEFLEWLNSETEPEQKNGKWILLSEKIPEMDERVLVIDNGYEYHVWDCMSNRGDEYFWEDEEGLYHNKYEVVAWLPFPEVIL